MLKRLLIPAALIFAVVLGSVVADAEIRQKGNLRISFSGGFSPHALPRERPVPITLDVAGEISTTDGSHPPALRRIEIGLHRNGQLSTVGLAACTTSDLQSTTTATALERCGPALVGRGSFKADFAFPGLGPVPASGPILAFNGRRGGKPALFFHLYTASPARITFVLPLTITHRRGQRFGTILAGDIPALASGLGSVSAIDLEIGRNYTYRGQRRSYISAACAAPAGFPGAIFSLARGNFSFGDGTNIAATLSRDCKVR
jgi:hypothetical protein